MANISTQIELNAKNGVKYASIDAKYGPYNLTTGSDLDVYSISDLHEYLVEMNYACAGLTVGVIENDTLKEYWYKEVEGTLQLVEKIPTELPNGGSEGQVLTKKADGGVEWTSHRELPETVGTQGQVLKIDGEGNPAWSDDSLPMITADDADKVLQVKNGKATWEALPEVEGAVTELPEIPENGEGSVLKVVDGKAEWADDAGIPAPAVSGTEGQVLKIKEGVPTWQDEEQAEAGTVLPEGGTEGQVLKTHGDGSYYWDNDNNTEAELPTEGRENGKVLKIVDGTPQWAEDADTVSETELPEITEANEGQVLKVVDGEAKWENDANTGSVLPEYTEADKNKVLTINKDSGEPAWEELSSSNDAELPTDNKEAGKVLKVGTDGVELVWADDNVGASFPSTTGLDDLTKNLYFLTIDDQDDGAGAIRSWKKLPISANGIALKAGETGIAKLVTILNGKELKIIAQSADNIAPTDTTVDLSEFFPVLNADKQINITALPNDIDIGKLSTDAAHDNTLLKIKKDTETGKGRVEFIDASAIKELPDYDVDTKGKALLVDNDGKLIWKFALPENGTSGQVLKSTGGTGAQWENQYPDGETGQVLEKTADGVQWANKYPEGTAGQILEKTASGAQWANKYPAGAADGKILKVVSGSPAWADEVVEVPTAGREIGKVLKVKDDAGTLEWADDNDTQTPNELPTFTVDNKNQVLKVAEDGTLVWANDTDTDDELPVFTTQNNKFLRVNSEGTAVEWIALPDALLATEGNNDKVLKVKNGIPSWETDEQGVKTITVADEDTKGVKASAKVENGAATISISVEPGYLVPTSLDWANMLQIANSKLRTIEIVTDSTKGLISNVSATADKATISIDVAEGRTIPTVAEMNALKVKKTLSFTPANSLTINGAQNTASVQEGETVQIGVHKDYIIPSRSKWDNLSKYVKCYVFNDDFPEEEGAEVSGEAVDVTLLKDEIPVYLLSTAKYNALKDSGKLERYACYIISEGTDTGTLTIVVPELAFNGEDLTRIVWSVDMADRADYYMVYTAPIDSTTWDDGVKVTSYVESSGKAVYTLDSLVLGTQYKIKGYKAIGARTAESAESTALELENLAVPTDFGALSDTDYTLTWQSVDNATNYRVYENNQTTYTEIDSTSYADIKLGIPYAVSAVIKQPDGTHHLEGNKGVFSGFTIGAPTNVELVYDSDKYKITWDAVSGATKYRIKEMNSNADYDAETSNTYYVFNSAEDVLNKTFTVWAVQTNASRDDLVGDTATISCGTIAAPANVQINTVSGDDGNSYTVTWDAVNGAVGYKVREIRCDENGTNLGEYTYDCDTTTYNVEFNANNTADRNTSVAYFKYEVAAYINDKIISNYATADATVCGEGAIGIPVHIITINPDTTSIDSWSVENELGETKTLDTVSVVYRYIFDNCNDSYEVVATAKTGYAFTESTETIE